MEAINIKGVDNFPSIIMDKEKGKLLIEGKSLPEDALDFYSPVIEWLNEYNKAPNKKTLLELKIHYFNTASSKMILFILQKIVKLSEKSHVEVHWYYFEDDEDMMEAGEIYAERINFPFKLIPM